MNRYDVNEAQRLVLSAAFHHGPGVWEFVPPGFLDEPFRPVAQAIHAVQMRGDKVTVVTLSDECLRRGIDPGIRGWMVSDTVDARRAADAFQEAHAREVLVSTLLHAQQYLDQGQDHWRVADEVSETLATLPRPVDPEVIAWHTYPEVIAFTADPPEWVIPNLLGRRERLVLTGKEGWGKSTLVYQIALGAAFGVSPVDTQTLFEPQRVLALDVENSHEAHVAQAWQKIGRAYERLSRTVFTPEAALLKLRQIDLLNPTQRGILLDAVDAYQPDLLVMGSGYKLVDATDDWRAIAQAIQRTADEAKARTGCAVIIETHAGHGNQGDRNGYRPDGSSFWLRWPEFGHGLAEVEDTEERMVKVVRWRGDRASEVRGWPAGWRGSEVLPWLAMTDDEVRFATRDL